MLQGLCRRGVPDVREEYCEEQEGNGRAAQGSGSDEIKWPVFGSALNIRSFVIHPVPTSTQARKGEERRQVPQAVMTSHTVISQGRRLLVSGDSHALLSAKKSPLQPRRRQQSSHFTLIQIKRLGGLLVG